MSKSANELLKEIQNIRTLSSKRNKKRRNETAREFLFRTSRYQCHYCRMPFPEKDLHAVRKHPHQKLPLIHDGICACSRCARKKGGLTHNQFLRTLKSHKKETKKAAYDNAKEINEIIFKKYHYTCIYCTYEYGYMPRGRKLTKDHKVPISRGGTNDLRNIACACEQHNKNKADRTADEYFKVIDRRKERKKNHSNPSPRTHQTKSSAIIN